MTPALANEVSCRFHDIMFANMDAVMVEYGESETDNMAGLLEGRYSSIVMRQGNKLLMVYMPRLSTQFIFDCYGQ